ncbi:ead/Ea22-like family protein [Salmonella enterica subsp. enterica]|nr:ead/Ea22-like family protein [Salmonella enterica subsp. enterica serovar Miami]EEG1560326.1 ead/Ea22-like family protein [Salmonella enterica subsp. enterica serovar Midway]EFR2203697.1 ead/Ea22-like family protein [Salmonella enterica]SQH88112.1 EaD [Salmonella enterica subsp. enterica] [Salmonella enterica subsp. enterica serovar Florida]EEH1322291.1 ead/Ea22-like family protein [Salmonella enterica subsp. enterica serovar Midway]
MTIDKQALREAAEKATPGPWEMEQENIWFTDEDGYTKHLVYVQQGDDVDDKQDHYNTAFIAAANPATMLALLDELDKKQQYIKLRDQENEDIALTVGKLRVELEHYKSREERVTKLVLDNSTSWDVLYEKLEAAERRIANNERVMRAVVEAASIRGIRPFEGIECDPPTLEENAEACGDAMSARIRELEANPPKPHHNGLMQISNELVQARQRIAELERSETQLINERDAAESALADMYQAATGERPEWSNMFGFADAVDVVEERLATLEANQSQTTPTGIQLITEAIGAHGYIVGCLLQGRPDLALEESRKWVSAFGQAAEIVSAQDAAGIKVKG